MTDPVSLHVNLIVLGRAFCNTRERNSPACPLRMVCPPAVLVCRTALQSAVMTNSVDAMERKLVK